MGSFEPEVHKDYRWLELLKENEALRRENEALKKKLDFARGGPCVIYVAGLPGGEPSRYKDGYDLTTKHGRRLEVKWSKVQLSKESNYRGWVWDNVLGRNETKTYEILVLGGQREERHEAQYPVGLPYVCFLVPRQYVDSIRTCNAVRLNTNLATARAPKSEILKRYLVRSEAEFRDF